MVKRNIPEELVGHYIICNTLEEWQKAILIVLYFIDLPNVKVSYFNFKEPKYISFTSIFNFNHSRLIFKTDFVPDHFKEYPLEDFLSKY